MYNFYIQKILLPLFQRTGYTWRRAFDGWPTYASARRSFLRRNAQDHNSGNKWVKLEFFLQGLMWFYFIQVIQKVVSRVFVEPWPKG